MIGRVREPGPKVTGRYLSEWKICTTADSTEITVMENHGLRGYLSEKHMYSTEGNEKQPSPVGEYVQEVAKKSPVINSSDWKICTKADSNEITLMVTMDCVVTCLKSKCTPQKKMRNSQSPTESTRRAKKSPVVT